MHPTDANAQEEWAFDALDEALDAAVWRPGSVQLAAPNTLYFCYDIPKLKAALKEMATSAVARKYARCNINVDPVVTNIIEEYAHELNRYNIRDNGLPTKVKA